MEVFRTDKTTVFDATPSDSGIIEQHGGGHYGLMESFVSAVAQNNPKKILSGPEETLESHLIVFVSPI